MKTIARLLLILVMLPFATISIVVIFGAVIGAVLCVLAEIDDTPFTAALALCSCEVAWLLVLLLIFR